ncbi:MAG: DUF1015 domain-containing protein [Thermoplasmata archaeon]|nr:DUF1015 domain-containing protein [Thermoplasmata archaeon]
MVDIKPFKGYHYNLAKAAKAPEKLVAPPYDVISKEMLAKLQSEAMNISNVMLGDRGDSYSNASRIFGKWIESGLIVSDEKACYYAYEQTFRLEGRIMQRTGLTALFRLEPFGKNVLPHERTHVKAKADRLQLLSAVRANIEQIFMIYEDRQNALAAVLERIKQPNNEVFSFVDPSDVRHRLFRISRDSDIEMITNALKGKKVLIADGHHRYETALEFSRLTDSKVGEGVHDYVLATLVNSYDPGLKMLPAHRLIHSVDEDIIASLPEKLETRFDVDEMDDRIALLDRLEGMEGCSTIGLWFTKKKRGMMASLRTEFCSDDPVERLDVSVLHKYVIEELLRITPEMQENMEKIEFVKGTEEAFKEAEKGDFQLICLLPSTSIPEIFEAAETGRKLPHKSTYFYPKLWSGLVMYVF